MNERENEEQTHAANDGGSPQRPVAKFSGSGGIQLAVWKHKSESGRDNYSVRIERSYKGDDEEFQSTNYLRDGDLLRAQKLLSQADDWIESDRSKQRASAQTR